MWKKICFVSVLLNVALAVVLVLLGHKIELPAINDDAKRSSLLAESSATYDGAKAAGWPEGAARLLLSSLLHSREPKPTGEYWKSDAVRLQEQRTAELRFHAAARAALKQVLGAAAADDPNFAPYFRPLANEWDSLPAEKQVAVEEIWLASAQGASSLHLKGAAEVLSRVRQVLSPEELVEYEIRYGAFANYLRAANSSDTEEAFRSAYLSHRASSHSDATTAQEVTIDPKSDPKYRLLTNIGRKHGVDAAAIRQAYELVRNESSKIDEQGFASSAAARSKRLDDLLGEAAHHEFDSILKTVSGKGGSNAQR